MAKRLITLILAITAVLSATDLFAQAAPTRPDANATYVVGAEDVIRITVVGEQEMSGTFKVEADGTINYWRLGRVNVSKRTVREIEDQITKLLLGGYLIRPQVSVGVEQFRSRNVFVVGDVVRPNKYALSGETTLLEVLMTMAGGPTAAAGNQVRILASKSPEPGAIAPVLPDSENMIERATVDLRALRSGQLRTNIMLQDGDTIFVPPADRFYISGEVRNQGNHILEKGMTVGQAIATAGGLTEKGSDRRMKIRRQLAPGKFVLINVKMTDPVLPGDEVIIQKRRI
jgi:polysaccharide export outer membrane protein